MKDAVERTGSGPCGWTGENPENQQRSRLKDSNKRNTNWEREFREESREA